MDNGYSYFSNFACSAFPCHKAADREDFNCLFCYCPLYPLENCGGNPQFTASGVKDCSNCLLPHKAKNYRYSVEKLMQLK